MQKKTKLLLFLIFIFALVVRFWNLGVYPNAIDEDEMAAGYYGYSLVHNGTDEYGHKFPIYFESVGDYKYGLMFYLEAIPVGIFGLSPISTRSVSAVAGGLSVIALFFLAYEILKKEEYGLIAAFVLAINPTHIHFSRVAYSNILGALFAIVSITLFIQWVKGGRFWRLGISYITFLLSIFTYQTYRIFLPLVFILLLVSFWEKYATSRVRMTIFTILAAGSVILSFIPSVSRARSQSASQLINMPNIIEQLSEDGMAGSSILESRIYHNKVAGTALGLAGRYFEYFDPKFLFVEASSESGRHSTPGVGLTYLIEAPLFLIGLIFLGKKIEGNKKYIPLILIIAAPVAASSIIGPVSTTRAIVLVYGMSLITALGVYVLSFSNPKLSKIVLTILGIAYLANFSYFAHQYTVQKVYHHPWYSDVGLKEMVQTVNRLDSSYKNIVVEGGHYIPFLFYNKVLPQDFLANSTFNSIAQANGAKIKQFGKIVFNMPECPKAGKKDVLYVCFDYKVPRFAKLIEPIYYKDGQPAIILIEFIGKASSEKLPERLEYSDQVDPRFINGILPNNYESYWPVQE